MDHTENLALPQGLSPTMSLNTAIGDLVRYTGRNGYPIEHETALKKGLVVGQEYAVLGMRVGNSSSEVIIAQGAFNTCIFDNTGVVPDIMPDDGRLTYVTRDYFRQDPANG